MTRKELDAMKDGHRLTVADRDALLDHIAEQERVIDQLREALVKENELIKAGVLGALLGLPCVLSKNEIEAKINEAVDQAQAALDAAGRSK